jgi:hypothetical protein
MTAIFALWNTDGFSLAADSNQRINEPGQIWIDPVQKIFPLENHQVAFGGAGDASIDLVDVNVLISTWAKNLSTPLPNLEDYLVSFLNWFNDQNLPSTTPTFNIAEFDEALEKTFNALNSAFPNYKQSSTAQVNDFLSRYLMYKKPVHQLNIYGNRFYELELNNLSYETSQEVMNYTTIANIHQKVKEHRLNSDSYEKFLSTNRERCSLRAQEVFPAVIGEEFDPNKEWHIGMINYLIEVHENYVFPENSFARCVLIGYGDEDWIPRALVFRMYDSDWGVRQVAIERMCHPSVDWYVSIGIESGVDEMTLGYSNDFLESLIEASSEVVDEPTASDLKLKAHQLGINRFHRTLKRIESLTVRRLEFVARLFVELEALKSYLNEPLPGVGGDVQYITMTKNSTKSGVYHEYS